MTGPVDRAGPPRAWAALDELGRLLLAEHTPPSVLQRIVELVQRALPAAAGVSITVIRDDHPATPAFTGRLAADLDETQYGLGCGPCLDAARSGQLTAIADARTEHRWPDNVPALLAKGVLSVLAAPVPAPQLTAGLNVYGRTAHAFTAADRSTLVRFAAYGGAALANMDVLHAARELAANLQKASEFRAVIEQAKGILAERHKLTVEQAFRLLAEASMHTHRKVRHLAEHLVLTGELTGAPPLRRPPPDGGG